jgi:ribosomal protein S3
MVIAKEISRKKTVHKRYLYSIIKILSQIYRQKILPIKGLRLVIAGKIDSKERKKKIAYIKGSLKLQTFNTKLLYNLTHYDTKFGVISLRF